MFSDSSQATFGGVIYDAGSWTGASADRTQETPEHFIDVWEEYFQPLGDMGIPQEMMQHEDELKI